MLRISYLLLMMAVVSIGRAEAQDAPRDSMMSGSLDPVVVTATRSAKELRNVPVPMTLITQEELRSRGALRLSDALAGETGLMIVHDHGTGIQLQGFDPAYTMILIDGDPVIGRTAGTLDLDRLSIADVERIEIVRGPSSSLYGSEALAGVINIITRTPAGTSGTLSARAETYGTTSFTANGELQRNRVAVRVTVDRFASDGYDLTPQSVGATFTDYGFSSTTGIELAEFTDLRLGLRLATHRQQNEALVDEADESLAARDIARSTDWSIAPRLTHRLGRGLTLTTRAYLARYATEMELMAAADERTINLSAFDQMHGRGEAQLDAVLGSKHLVIAGGGYTLESVEADRIRGARQRVASGFAMLQHEYLPVTWLDLSTSVRFDAHGAYGTRVSPKIAALLRPADGLRVRMSVGSGFKAPTFEELYLDFSNPTAGYTVFGSVDVAEMLRRAEETGQISRLLVDPDQLAEVGPETSVAVNLGFEADPLPWLEARVNIFHNEVNDLIETAPVAVKQNGQNVFTYFNLNRIYTRGAEVELTVRPIRSTLLSAGYQLLDARDRDVLEAIDAGTIYKRVNGRDRRVSRAEYGGLMNRSRHSLTLRAKYQSGGFAASVRGMYRSRYGFGDVNGNLILDDAREYVPGYWLWNVTLSRDMGRGIVVETGARNLFDETNPSRIPSLPGRVLFAGIRVGI